MVDILREVTVLDRVEHLDGMEMRFNEKARAIVCFEKAVKIRTMRQKRVGFGDMRLQLLVDCIRK